ncbi:MAG TPA: ribosome maturation factor RimM [Candidatus Binatia bacterium]|nr:ribosome maturation factor RimM [Candidatus Binatia bacterium]
MTDHPEHVAIGMILRPHGVAGEVRVRPLTDRPRERFGALEKCIVLGPGSEERVRREVIGCRFDRDFVLLRLAGVDSMEDAAGLVGRVLAVDAAEVLPAPPGHFYPWQLAGARVETRDGRVLGRFIGVEPGVAQELWVVGEGERKWLVPAVPEIVVEVDVAGRRVVLDPPEGLFDL